MAIVPICPVPAAVYVMPVPGSVGGHHASNDYPFYCNRVCCQFSMSYVTCGSTSCPSPVFISLTVFPLPLLLHYQVSPSNLLSVWKLSRCRVTDYPMSCAGPLARDSSGTTCGTPGYLAKHLAYYYIKGIN
jgi:hypothetical protein